MLQQSASSSTSTCCTVRCQSFAPSPPARRWWRQDQGKYRYTKTSSSVHYFFQLRSNSTCHHVFVCVCVSNPSTTQKSTYRLTSPHTYSQVHIHSHKLIFLDLMCLNVLRSNCTVPYLFVYFFVFCALLCLL